VSCKALCVYLSLVNRLGITKLARIKKYKGNSHISQRQKIFVTNGLPGDKEL